MKIKLLMVFNVVLTVCLVTALLFTGGTLTGESKEYDPWHDTNDDGIIDMADISILIDEFMSEGPPINKTALLLELESRVEALETRVPKKGFLSVSPEAFTPEEDTQAYYKSWICLRGDGSFSASLELPHGAILRNMTVYLTDMVSDGGVTAGILGYNLTQGYGLTIPMADVATNTTETPGSIVLYDDTIDDANVDNQNCVYCLQVAFTYNTVFLALKGVLIEYEYQA